MLRHVIFFNTFCVFLAGSFNIINPGPAFPPTKGEVWPKPQQQSKEDIYFNLLPLSFTITAKGETCVLMNTAIERYTRILRSTVLTAYKHSRKQWKNFNDTDTKFMGSLQELQINLSKPCESYPHLDMDERYSLSVAVVSKLNSDSIWGVLRGLETFVQLFYTSERNANLLINATQIEDFPKYTHRGLLIDTARHYLSVSTILQLLNAMEMNKMNVLHWHIVDDQSFPYQSEKFPNLSEAAYDPTMIYTAANINMIVNYARDRGIRVLPEFDVPGHTSSWGMAYPSILTKCYRFGREIGLGPMDPTQNITYKLINDLFREVQDRFPDKYFHVGGDEVEMDCWRSNPQVVQFMTDHNMTSPTQLHSYFMSRVLPLLGDRSKPIVWQEVFDEGVELPSGTIVQVWKNIEAREMIDILNAGHKVIYSSSWYLDSLSGGGDWTKFYSADPRDVVTRYHRDLNVDNILGGETCMWGEVVDDANVISRVWPRASAVAEILWSGGTPRTTGYYFWGPTYEVKCRLEEHVCRMNHRGLVKRKMLVLDLDETLIHSHHDAMLRPTVKPGTPPDFVLKVTIDKHPVRFFVHKRPHVDYFLDIVSQWYELVVFTASMEIYGAAVADKLDNGRGILRRRFYRQHCTAENGSYTKNLSSICDDLNRVFILDNSPGAYRDFPDNAIPIKSWFSDPLDVALLNLLPVLDALRFTHDVRSVLSRNLHLHRLW